MRLLIISFLILLLGVFQVLNPVKDVLVSVFGPLEYGLRNLAIEIKSAGTFYTNLRAIRNENLGLLEKVESLEEQLLAAQKAEQENKILKEQLDLTPTSLEQKQLVLTGVLGNPSDRTGTTLVLDKGSSSGIKPGNNVILGDKLIGVVSKVSLGRSVVDIITSGKVTIVGYDIDSSTLTEGVVTGSFGTSLKMTKILPNESIKINDKILTSGRDGIFEPGLIIGTVSRVEGQVSEPLRTAYLESAVDFNKLTKVFVVLF